MNKGKNMPEHAAIAAKPPPSARDPVSPMNTFALYLLWTKNPMHAPAIDAPKIPRSEGTIQVNGALLLFFLQTSLYLIGNWKTTYNQGNTDMALQSH